MLWTITRIDDADFGCEERMPGEPLMALVHLENEFGQEISFEVPDIWLTHQQLKEGDEWPENLEEENPDDKKSQKQADWMERYLDALEELL